MSAGRKLASAFFATSMILTAVALYAPEKAGAPIMNSAIYADWAPNNGGWGPGIKHLWYPDWWPGLLPNMIHDLMWFGSYDFLGTAPAGSSTLSYWQTADMPANGTPPIEPGPGKWADDHRNTPLFGGAMNQIDSETLQVTFTGSRSTGATYNLVQTFYTLPGQRTIRVTVDVTNTAMTAFDFAYYHAEDLCAGDWQNVGYGNNDLNGDSNDAANNLPPFDGQNTANAGPGDPGDLWDERILKYSGPGWTTANGGWSNPANPSRVTTSGWKGQGWGFVTVVDGSGRDLYTQNWGVPAIPPPDGTPDDFASLISYETNVDWYVGRWDAAVWGPGLYSQIGSPPFLFDAYYTWEDVFEVNYDSGFFPPYWIDSIYMDSPGHSTVDTDNGVGLLKDLGTIGPGQTKTTVFYIGEPPEGRDLVISSGDIKVGSDYGSAYQGSGEVINATIWNFGTVNVENSFDVQFYSCVDSGVVDPDANDDGVVDASYLAPAGCGNLLGTVTVTNSVADPLVPFGSKWAELSWTPNQIGSHDIWVVVDYPADGTVDEINSPDNEWRNNRARYDTTGLLPGALPPFASDPPFYEVHPPPEFTPPFITGLNTTDATVNLTWQLSPSVNVNAYDVYGGLTQTSIDFTSPLYSTPNEPEPAAQWWAEFPFDTVGNPEQYFAVKARNNSVPVVTSASSNTAGYYNMSFAGGNQTFSLPLKPLTTRTVDWYLTNIPNALSISHQMDNDDWSTIAPPLMPPYPAADVGSGYVLELSGPSSFVFTGEPGAMIRHRSDFSWDFPDDSLVNASVDAGSVTLTWDDLGTGIEYYVYRSGTRNGFFPGSPGSYSVLNGGNPLPSGTTTYVDAGAASAAGEDYYMIVPFNTSSLEKGAGTYSVGVAVEEYSGNDFFGLPLDPMGLGEMSADWYADDIPYCLGIVYLEADVWKPHFREFPQGVYDTTVSFGKGYELTVYSTALYTYIGW